MDKLLTVIVQTSPLPSHPSTALLEALFRSFDRVEHLKECNIIVLCDGCDEEPSILPAEIMENEEAETTSSVNNGDGRKTNYKHGSVSREAATDYRLHLKLLHEKIESREHPFAPLLDGSIRLLKLPHRHGSAKAIVAAFDILSIDTPYVLIAQHDNFFVRDVHYLRQLIQYMETEGTESWLRCIHFPSTATLNYVEKVRRRYGLDLEKYCRLERCAPQLCGNFIPLAFWYGRTHIARTRYYTEKILADYPPKAGDHLEEIWGTRQLDEIMELKKSSKENNIEASFEDLHAKYGNYVFFENDMEGEERQHQEVLYHFSGRKARATNAAFCNTIHSVNYGEQNSNKAIFHPREKSFTTARRAMAVVPGLEIATKMDVGSETSMIGDPKPTGRSKPRSKFRQRCFHCGEKGHSFKFCPEICRGEQMMPDMEILDLS